MLNRLKDRAKITDQDPTFKARYVGHTETFTASGRGCTTLLVQKLWDNSEEERFLKRVQIKITTSGIHIKNLEKKKEPEKLFPIENISFCNVDTQVNERIFSWICCQSDSKILECHAVVCGSGETAKSMSLVLSRAFQIAYKDWKTTQTKTRRESEKHHRSKSLPVLNLVSEKRGLAKQQSLVVAPSSSTSLKDVDLHAVDGAITQTEAFPVENGVTKADFSKEIGIQAEM